jgi:hypothetical protein
MSKTSVPMLHSAAALLKLAEAEYRGATVWMEALSALHACPKGLRGLVGRVSRLIRGLAFDMCWTEEN